MRSSGWWRGLASGKPAVGAFSPGRCLWWAPQFCEFSQVGVCVRKSARADPAFVRASDVASQLKRNRKLEDTREPEQRANATKGGTRGTRFLVSRVRPLRVLLSLAGSYYYAVSLHNKIHSTALFVKWRGLGGPSQMPLNSSLCQMEGTRRAESDAASLLFVNAAARAVEVVGLGCGVRLEGGTPTIVRRGCSSFWMAAAMRG